MAVEYKCSGCGHSGTASEKYAGRIVKCPKCELSIEIPPITPPLVNAADLRPPTDAAKEAKPPVPVTSSPIERRNFGLGSLAFALFLTVMAIWSDLGFFGDEPLWYDESATVAERARGLAIARVFVLFTAIAFFVGSVAMLIPLRVYREGD